MATSIFLRGEIDQKKKMLRKVLLKRSLALALALCLIVPQSELAFAAETSDVALESLVSDESTESAESTEVDTLEDETAKDRGETDEDAVPIEKDAENPADSKEEKEVKEDAEEKTEEELTEDADANAKEESFEEEIANDEATETQEDEIEVLSDEVGIQGLDVTNRVDGGYISGSNVEKTSSGFVATDPTKIYGMLVASILAKDIIANGNCAYIKIPQWTDVSAYKDITAWSGGNYSYGFEQDSSGNWYWVYHYKESYLQTQTTVFVMANFYFDGTPGTYTYFTTSAGVDVLVTILSSADEDLQAQGVQGINLTDYCDWGMLSSIKRKNESAQYLPETTTINGTGLVDFSSYGSTTLNQWMLYDTDKATVSIAAKSISNSVLKNNGGYAYLKLPDWITFAEGSGNTSYKYVDGSKYVITKTDVSSDTGKTTVYFNFSFTGEAGTHTLPENAQSKLTFCILKRANDENLGGKESLLSKGVTGINIASYFDNIKVFKSRDASGAQFTRNPVTSVSLDNRVGLELTFKNIPWKAIAKAVNYSSNLQKQTPDTLDPQTAVYFELPAGLDYTNMTSKTEGLTFVTVGSSKVYAVVDSDLYSSAPETLTVSVIAKPDGVGEKNWYGTSVTVTEKSEEKTSEVYGLDISAYVSDTKLDKRTDESYKTDVRTFTTDDDAGATYHVNHIPGKALYEAGGRAYIKLPEGIDCSPFAGDVIDAHGENGASIGTVTYEKDENGIWYIIFQANDNYLETKIKDSEEGWLRGYFDVSFPNPGVYDWFGKEITVVPSEGDASEVLSAGKIKAEELEKRYTTSAIVNENELKLSTNGSLILTGSFLTGETSADLDHDLAEFFSLGSLKLYSVTKDTNGKSQIGSYIRDLAPAEGEALAEDFTYLWDSATQTFKIKLPDASAYAVVFTQQCNAKLASGICLEMDWELSSESYTYRSYASLTLNFSSSGHTSFEFWSYGAAVKMTTRDANQYESILTHAIYQVAWYKDGEWQEKEVLKTSTTDKDVFYTHCGTKQLVKIWQTTPPDDYTLNDKPQYYIAVLEKDLDKAGQLLPTSIAGDKDYSPDKVQILTVADEGATYFGLETLNTKQKTTGLDVTVIWKDKNGNIVEDASSMPEVITTLTKCADYGDTKVEDKAISADNSWTHTWDSLGYDDNTTYTLTETAVDGYSTTYTVNGKDISEGDKFPLSEDATHVVIINVKDKVYGDVEVKRQWADANGNLITSEKLLADMPKVTVTLSRMINRAATSEIVLDTQVLSLDNNWTYVWKDMEYDDGYEYFVTETTSDGDSVTYALNGNAISKGDLFSLDKDKTQSVVIESKLDKAYSSIQVQKKWKDIADTKELSSVVVLTKNAATGYSEVGSQILNDDNDWTYTWDALEYGDDITYTVAEKDSDGYTTTYTIDGKDMQRGDAFALTKDMATVVITSTKVEEKKSDETKKDETTKKDEFKSATNNSSNSSANGNGSGNTSKAVTNPIQKVTNDIATGDVNVACLIVAVGVLVLAICALTFEVKKKKKDDKTSK